MYFVFWVAVLLKKNYLARMRFRTGTVHPHCFIPFFFFALAHFYGNRLTFIIDENYEFNATCKSYSTMTCPLSVYRRVCFFRKCLRLFCLYLPLITGNKTARDKKNWRIPGRYIMIDLPRFVVDWLNTYSVEIFRMYIFRVCRRIVYLNCFVYSHRQWKSFRLTERIADRTQINVASYYCNRLNLFGSYNYTRQWQCNQRTKKKKKRNRQLYIYRIE